jgi:hypothetical protein
MFPVAFPAASRSRVQQRLGDFLFLFTPPRRRTACYFDTVTIKNGVPIVDTCGTKMACHNKVVAYIRRLQQPGQNVGAEQVPPFQSHLASIVEPRKPR